MPITPDAPSGGIQPDAPSAIAPDTTPEVQAPTSSIQPDPVPAGGIQADSPASALTPHSLATPHKYDRAISNAAKGAGFDADILRAVGVQETDLGRSPNYDAKNGIDRNGNAGHGLFQLDPAAGPKWASKADLDKAAKDPKFAAQRAADMIKTNLKATGGNIRQALAMYNTGDPNSPVGLAYADEVLRKKQALDPMNTDPEIVQQVKHDIGVVQKQLKRGKPLDQALGRTKTFQGLRKIEADNHISWQWIQDHPTDAVLNVLGAPQRALGGFEYAASQGKDLPDAVHAIKDFVLNPTEKNQQKATDGPANVINSFAKKYLGAKGNVDPTHDEIDAFIKAHHTGALEPYFQAVAKGGRDMANQLVSDPLIVDGLLKHGLTAAIGTATGITKAAHAIAQSQGVGKLFNHLPYMAQAGEKAQDIFTARRDIEKAGFTKEGKNVRLAIENSELAKRSRNEQVDIQAVHNTTTASKRYLEYARDHGAPKQSNEASRLLGVAPHANPTGHMIAGNITNRLADIAHMSTEELTDMFKKLRGGITDKAIAERTVQLTHGNPKLFNGNVAAIHNLGIRDESSFMKNLDAIAKNNPVAELGKRAVMWNPMPHGLKNVGTLAYMAGGMPAVMHGMIGMAKGVDKATLQRLEDIGAMPIYIDKAASKWGKAMHSTLERTEQGWRAGLLKVLDERLGVGTPGSVKEMLKGQIISNHIGDYRNQSAFVKMFQALGGPFVAFRLGIVPARVAETALKHPSRIVQPLRAGQDIQNNRSTKGKKANRYEMGGPIDDAIKLGTNTAKFLGSASTEGPISALNSSAAGDNKGIVGHLLDMANSYIPGASSISEGAKILGGHAMPGPHGEQHMSWADQLGTAIGNIGLGGHFQKQITKKQENIKNKKIRKQQGL